LDFCFFFQAEDGIRGFHVTGVQTCALPIYALSQKLQVIGVDPNLLQASNISKSVALRSPINGFVSKVNVSMGKYVAPTDVLFERSEERRVGKECRSRCSQ